MYLIAYERLTEHGFALPLFGTSVSANALSVAVPSEGGDPTATLAAFEVHDPQSAISLDKTHHRLVAVGDDWVDVFLWNGVAHVGTKPELWTAMAFARDDISKHAPLTLLALSEGADFSETVRCAKVAHGWLKDSWGTIHADSWRLNGFLRRQAWRDLYRRLRQRADIFDARLALERLPLTQQGAVLQLGLPRSFSTTAAELPNLASAATSFGWRLEITIIPDEALGKPTLVSSNDPELLMRLRHGRGRTQTQIPLRVVDRFFGNIRTLKDLRTGSNRTMTLSMAGDRRNTMKLQLPEIANMVDPVARFIRTGEGIQFEVYDSSSPNGRIISNQLKIGLKDSSTQQTRGGATWWRLIA
ncbi:hypothetical protein [Blastomonas sp.]|uniref:hypothetical protein n=1 Tax=Blastomonas sp. TaxID=1909299 RepID=UPI003918C47D